MGERTQALITVKYGNSKTKASVSIHYQWGYGRYMLMDVLNQGIYLINKAYDLRDESREELAKGIFDRSTGVINFVTYESGVSAYDETGFGGRYEPYQETIEDVMKFSDNNDGYAHLEMVFDENGFSLDDKTRLRLFDFEGQQIGLNKFCENGKEFATKDFIKGYRLLLENYGINLEEESVK